MVLRSIVLILVCSWPLITRACAQDIRVRVCDEKGAPYGAASVEITNPTDSRRVYATGPLTNGAFTFPKNRIPASEEHARVIVTEMASGDSQYRVKKIQDEIKVQLDSTVQEVGRLFNKANVLRESSVSSVVRYQNGFLIALTTIGGKPTANRVYWTAD